MDLSAVPAGEPGQAKPPVVDPAVWEAEFKSLVEEIETAAREWGIRPDSLEWRFVQAFIGSTRFLGRLTTHAQAIVDARSQRQRDAAELDLERARQLVKSANLAVMQARNAQIAATVHQESVTQRMIDETLPMFADRLKKALIIREVRWNRERAWKRYALAGLTVLGIFGSGYALASWSGDGRLAAFDRCLAQPILSGGHIYCALDWAAAGGSQPAADGQN